jgi:ADP-heptose:LPS heptosyltransferase
VVVSPSFITALIIFICGIRYKIGTGYRWYSFLFNKKIFEHRKHGEKHELDFNVDLLLPLGIQETVNFNNVKFNFSAGPEKKSLIQNVLKEKKISLSKPVIIVHPGSRGSAVDWPVSRFKQLIGIILKEIDAAVLLTGNASEKALCEELQVSEEVINFAGKFDLTELIALIDTCDIFISNSTGPIHIAAALGKFTIGFYPKIPACSPQRWGPYTKNKTIFTPSIDCLKCTRNQCIELNCMASIIPEEVITEIKRVCNIIPNKGELNV